MYAMKPAGIYALKSLQEDTRYLARLDRMLAAIGRSRDEVRWYDRGDLAEAARELGARHVLVVHGHDGLDEISLSGPTEVAELRAGEVHRYRLQPSEFGLPAAPLAALQIADVKEAAQVFLAVLRNEPGPRRDIVLLNAGAALYAADVVPDLATGVERARAAMDSGAAWAKWEALLHCAREL